jgi:hypothetical protein
MTVPEDAIKEGLEMHASVDNTLSAISGRDLTLDLTAAALIVTSRG